MSERALISPDLAVSTVVFALAPPEELPPAPAGPNARAAASPPPHDTPPRTHRLVLPLVRRVRRPFHGLWALPGGPLRMHESLDDAAGRHLRAATGLEPPRIEQLHAFGGLDRSPSLRVVSIVYWSLLPLAASSSALARTQEIENVAWFDVEGLPHLAFDHARIVGFALDRLRTSTTWGRLACDVLDERFTLAQLREVCESVAGHPLDPGNFQRQAKADPHIEATEEFLTGGRHRPPRLYRSTTPEADPR